MIPAHGYVARFKQTSGDRTWYDEMPVIAWDEDRGALVADEKTGRLRAASSYSNFARVSPASAPIVGAIPGGGWVVEYEEDGTSTYPVLGWLVHGDGELEPVDVDTAGIPTNPTTVESFKRLYHPGYPPAEEAS